MASKIFVCETCGVKMDRSSSFKRHIALHTGDRPFRCPNPGCNYSAIQKTHLKNHLERHREQTTKRPLYYNPTYECSECDYSTIYKVQFDAHILTHLQITSLECLDCNFIAPSEQILFRHNLLHTGKPFYKCPECNFVGKKPLEVRRHLIAHIDQKPCKCPLTHCNFATNQLAGLKCHMLIHLGETACYCDICTNSSIRKSEAVQHKKETFICSKCQYVTGKQEELLDHSCIQPNQINLIDLDQINLVNLEQVDRSNPIPNFILDDLFVPDSFDLFNQPVEVINYDEMLF